jgi:hypothetical protein
MSLIEVVENSNLDNLCSKLECHVVSNVFSMSKNKAAVNILLLKLRVSWSVSLIHCSVVLWHARKQNWLALSSLLSSMCFWTILWMTFSKNLSVVERRLIGPKFWENFMTLPGFGNFMIFVSFQDFAKWNSRRQWLNKCVKCTNVRLGRCLMHSFGMPSIPQGFLNFKELNNFCKLHGLILSGGLFMISSRVWTLVFTRRSWFSSQNLWRVNWFSKQSAIALEGWNRRPERPWIEVGVLGPSLFKWDFAMGQIAWDMTSV